jgi:hypothetical protein
VPQTFRRKKVQDFVKRLQNRSIALMQESRSPLMSESRLFILKKGRNYMQNTQLAFLYRLVWFVGFFILLLAENYYVGVFTKLKYSFIVLPWLWFEAAAPIILGMYTAIIFVRKWGFKPNSPILFCIALPCLILTFYIPAAYTMATFNIHVHIPTWYPDLDIIEMASFVGGLTLIRGLFSSNNK